MKNLQSTDFFCFFAIQTKNNLFNCKDVSIGEKLKKTIEVKIGNVKIGNGNQIVVQSMTNTNTADVQSTVQQIIELAEAGSELVRFTVENEKMAEAVKLIKKELIDHGVNVPLVGDFHYNGHLLLTQVPSCAEALDKYRINPGNVGFGESHDNNFKSMIEKAIEYGKPVRIGVNWGSLDKQVLAKLMDENSKKAKPKPANAIVLDAIVESAIQSTNIAVNYGLEPSKIVLSAKTSSVQELIYVNEQLSEKSNQPIHLGLTEAGMGEKGIISSTAGISILLQKGIGDTIRASLTPKPGQSRTAEVIVCKQILQSLGLRNFLPQVTSCPGCGRTTSSLFQEISLQVNEWLLAKMPEWKTKNYKGVENLQVAVMGCIVNGPGESKNVNIGLSLPGSGESPRAPVYADGKQIALLQGEKIGKDFIQLIEKYVEKNYLQ